MNVVMGILWIIFMGLLAGILGMNPSAYVFGFFVATVSQMIMG